MVELQHWAFNHERPKRASEFCECMCRHSRDEHASDPETGEGVECYGNGCTCERFDEVPF